jgi:H+/Na+-translocating ferredoxin:NAD+ oxidoreductase subunit B
MNVILLAVLVLFGVGLALSLLLVFFSRIFHVEEDPRIDDIEEALPGANCGACGLAGCRDYAKTCVATGEIPPCPVGGSETAENVAKILGVKATDVLSMVALVKCAGTADRAKSRGDFEGVKQCKEAFLLGGSKECRFGCMGYGDCIRVCPADAIIIYKGGVAHVDNDKCIGCGLCVLECPVNAIEMVPADREVHVLCNSKDPAAVTRTQCTVGCIACKICARKDNQFVIADNVAVFSGTKSDSEVPFVCPNDVIVDTKQYSVLAFLESAKAREEYGVLKAAFKEKEKEVRLKALAAKKAAALKAAEEKKLLSEKEQSKEDKDV